MIALQPRASPKRTSGSGIAESGIVFRWPVCLAMRQHDHVMPRPMIRAGAGLRQDLRRRDAAAHDARRAEPSCVGHGVKPAESLRFFADAKLRLADPKPRPLPAEQEANGHVCRTGSSQHRNRKTSAHPAITGCAEISLGMKTSPQAISARREDTLRPKSLPTARPLTSSC